MTMPKIATPKLSRPPVPDDGVNYPEAHDVLLVESMLHFVPQAYMQTALQTWYTDEPTTLVASNMFIYYEPGDNNKSVGPDVYVIPGVVNAPQRRSYFMWVERSVPVFVVEVLSRGTYANDLGFKWELYQSWGVTEYWLYDPNYDDPVITPPLQGYRLVNGLYQAIPIAVDPQNEECRGRSDVLGLELHGNRQWFRFYDPANEEYIMDREEAEYSRRTEREGRLTAEGQRDAEREGRLTAEGQRDAEREGRLTAEGQRDAEREGRRAAEARAAQLESEIRRLRGE